MILVFERDLKYFFFGISCCACVRAWVWHWVWDLQWTSALQTTSNQCNRVYSTSSSNLAAISDSEVIDDDALSTDCQDDLREIENERDDKEHTADKVAPSVADLINKKFSKGLSDEKLITWFSENWKLV